MTVTMMNKPIVRWDKTQSTWHTDVDNVGRYAVRRMDKRKPYAAYLNNERIMSESVHSDAEIVKRAVETRIEKAFDIAKTKLLDADVRRTELISAARGGIGIFLNSMRGANMFGAGAKVVPTTRGFCVVWGSDNRIYFETTEM